MYFEYNLKSTYLILSYVAIYFSSIYIDTIIINYDDLLNNNIISSCLIFNRQSFVRGFEYYRPSNFPSQAIYGQNAVCGIRRGCKM